MADQVVCFDMAWRYYFIAPKNRYPFELNEEKQRVVFYTACFLLQNHNVKNYFG